jgi:hypothetical protein
MSTTAASAPSLGESRPDRTCGLSAFVETCSWADRPGDFGGDRWLLVLLDERVRWLDAERHGHSRLAVIRDRPGAPELPLVGELPAEWIVPIVDDVEARYTGGVWPATSASPYTTGSTRTSVPARRPGGSRSPPARPATSTRRAGALTSTGRPTSRRSSRPARSTDWTARQTDLELPGHRGSHSNLRDPRPAGERRRTWARHPRRVRARAAVCSQASPRPRRALPPPRQPLSDSRRPAD